MAGRGINLKDEKEVKEYLENLGIEYRFGCYHEKDPKACHLLGDYMEIIKGDLSKALKVYQTNCDEYNYGHSCAKVGSYKFVGRACSRDMDETYKYFDRSCQLGYAQGCFNAGLMDIMSQGIKVPRNTDLNKDVDMRRKQTVPDPAKGVEYIKKSCEGDVAEGCHRYASMLIAGFKDVVQKNVAAAQPYAFKACDLGIPDACINLSIMYKTGDGVERDEKLSKRYANIAKDIYSHMKENHDRITFQEGVETFE